MKYALYIALAAVMLFACGCANVPDKNDTPLVTGDDYTVGVTVSTVESVTITEETTAETTSIEEITTQEATSVSDATTTAEATAAEDVTEANTTAADAQTTAEAQAATEAASEEESFEPEGEVIEIEENKYFFLVNHEYPLPDDYKIETDYVQGSYELEKTAAKYCRDMIKAAKEDGIELKVLSAYRTVSYQQKLFDRNIKSRMEKYGMTYDEAYQDVLINIALPGTSEHNAGLAVDIVTMDDWDTYEAFEDTKEFKWLCENAADYGFILRYLKDKEDITGYIYEPWHYRFIGVEYAHTVRDTGLCLEEFFEEYVWGNEPPDIEETETE